MTLPAPLARLRLPVIGSPLFIVSNPDLVIAQCKAGIVGSFPALNARPQSQLAEWLHRITEELAAWDRDNPDRPARRRGPRCLQAATTPMRRRRRRWRVRSRTSAAPPQVPAPPAARRQVLNASSIGTR